MQKLIAVILILFSFQAFAQNDVLYLQGVVKDDRTGLKLSDVMVTLIQDGKVVQTFVTSLNGKFEADLPYDHTFDLRLEKKGYVSKFVHIDTRNVPKEEQVGGDGFDLDMSLFQTVEGVNFDILKQPIGIAKYSEATGNIDFDYEYTKSIQARIMELKRALEKKYAEDEKKLAEEQQAAEQEKLKQQRFEQLVKEGDEQFAATNYPNAIFKYSEALALKPGTKYVEDKLAAVKKAMDEQNLAKQKEQQYKDLISKADQAFTAKQYQQAIVSYNEAVKLKPGDNYPKDRIAEAQKILDDIATLAALDKKYSTEVKKADSLFKANKFEMAITSYESASALKPAEAYPRQKITEARTKLADEIKQKELDDKYKSLLAMGDAALKTATFQAAIDAYRQASELKPAEIVPKQKLTEAQAKLDAQNKQKAVDEEYKTVISSADAAFAAGQYDAALEGFKKASSLKPAETYPKTKITEVQGKLTEIAKKEALEKQYTELVAKADQAFAAGQYQVALQGFQQASALKPSEAYPKDKITETKAKLDSINQEKALNDQYKALVTKADQAFAAKQYAAALSSYQQASGLKPDEAYPRQKITEAQALIDELAKQRDLDEKYKGMITIADSAMKGNRFDDAIAAYNKALDLKPSEAYPKNRIAEANGKIDALNKQKALNEQYTALLSQADKMFQEEKWEDAVKGYKDASAIKPTEAYPKTKITEAQARIAAIQKQKQLEDQYSRMIASADSGFTAGSFQAAISKYQQASALKPAEQYPKDRITEAKTKIDELARKKAFEDQYKAIITKGDAAFASANYKEAITQFNQALAMKPDDVYPKEKIDQANAKLGEIEKDRLAKEEAYKTAVARGDDSFAKADYPAAKTAYNEALKIKPAEAYPKQKIQEADAKLAEITKKQALDKQYNDLVNRADSAFSGQQYTAAIQSYEKASLLKPSEQYPKDQVALARTKMDELAKKKALDDQYKAAITKADGLLVGGKYSEAIAEFKKALDLKPNEMYPQEKIDQANKKLAEIEKDRLAKEEAYNSAVQRGDDAFERADYNSAKAAYNEALRFKATEAYPKQRIQEADAKLAEIAKKEAADKQYADLITKADAAFSGTQYQVALQSYEQAAALKPAEQYPKDRIAETRGLLDEQNKLKAVEDQYKAAIAKADGEFKLGKLESALTSYEQAQTVKPQEQYPKQKIDEIRTKLTEQAAAKKLDQDYKDALGKADAAFTAKQYDAAITAYQQALTVKPAEAYPQDRIRQARAEIDKLGKQKQLDEQYKVAITRADSLFGGQKWAEAIVAYKEASTVKPTEAYPPQKIKEAEAKIAAIEKERLALEKKYNGFINKADSAFNKQSYMVARNFYIEAGNVKPNEQYPKDRIREVDAKLDELAKLEEERKAKEAAAKADPTIVSFKDITSFGDIKRDTVKKEVPAVTEAPQPKVMYRTTPVSDLEEFRKKLGEMYPDGKTSEKYVEGNKNIFRTIYVENKLGDEYLKVILTGYGTFYFKNGTSIGPADFDKGLSMMK